MQALFPHIEILQNRAIIYSSLGEYDKALDDSSKAILLMNSPRPGPYLNRAVTYKNLAKTKKRLPIARRFWRSIQRTRRQQK